MILRIFFLAVLVVIFSFLNFSGASFLGVKPNFALAAVIAILFFTDDALESIFLIAVSAMVLKFLPAAGKDILIYSIICVAAVFIKKYLPWRNFLGNLILVFSSTVLFYVFLFFKEIGSIIFIKEIVYNMVISGLVFFTLSKIKIFSVSNKKLFKK